MPMIQIPFGNTVVTRVEPVGRPQDYKTYTIAFPTKTHWRPATCEEVLCFAYLNGWATTVDLNTDLGQKQYHYIKTESGRSFTEEKTGSSLAKFSFGPGQVCFGASQHKVPLERPARFLVTPGDFRARTGTTRVHANGGDWAEDFALHQDKINTAIERG
jgi:hypothetical protein